MLCTAHFSHLLKQRFFVLLCSILCFVNFFRSAVLNEDEEDSAESSTDEEAEVTTYVTTSEAE